MTRTIMTRTVIFMGLFSLIMGCNIDYIKEDFGDGTSKKKNKENEQEKPKPPELKQPPSFYFRNIKTSSFHVSQVQILSRISGGNKIGWRIKDIRLSNSNIAEVLNLYDPKIRFLKYGIVQATITLKKEGYRDAVIRNCKFERAPARIKIFKISILKFPTHKDNGRAWDVKYWFESSNVTRPDLIFKIINRNSGLPVYILNSISKIANARQFVNYSRILNLTISKGQSYEFALYDYDQLEADDWMGFLHFSVPEDYAVSKIFKSQNQKIQIKVYFSYH